MLVPILIYKLLLALFGASSYLPFRMLAAFDLVLLAVVLGIICRRAWGKWWGLAPVLLLVTLGPGGVSLLWPFQTGFAIAIAAGLVALVALSRDGLRADLVACGALLISVASVSEGIGFLAGAAAIIVIRGDWRRRAWIVVVPAFLYGLWYLKYGQQASESQLSLWSTSLVYTMDALGATIAGVLGLSSVSPQTGVLDLTFGPPLALAAVAVLLVALYRGWRPRPVFWAALTTVIVLWVAASLSNTATFYRPPNDPRYLPSDAVLLMVCLCAAVPRPRLAAVGTIAVICGLVIIAGTNARQYTESRNYMLASDVASRAELGALLILRGVVGSGFSPNESELPGVLVNGDAGQYLSAIDAFGISADSPAMILGLDEATRAGIDHELERGELVRISFAPTAVTPAPRPPAAVSGTAGTRGNCLLLGDQPLVIRAGPGQYQLAATGRAPLTVAMARFSGSFDIPLGEVPAGRRATIRVPHDGAAQVPWRMRLTGSGARVCAVG